MSGAAPAQGRVCVIGAGSSGIASCQVLHARGIPFDCFEKGSGVGGNWRYMNDNGMSSAYESLHINTSRDMMAFASFPMPPEFPDYPNHYLIASYFNDYVDHFGFRDRIRFSTEVIRIEPAGEEWEVTAEDDRGRRQTERYAAVMVANGHHWDPRWPEPPFPGSDGFSGEQMHVHDYKTPEVLSGKRVLVLGIGNSACDVSVESSRTAEATFLAMRRGAHVIPKYLDGKPTDEAGSPALTRLPLWAQRRLFKRALEIAAGDVTDFGFPKPDHKLLEAHPTISSELLPRIGHGDIAVKPNIEDLDGGRVNFSDRSSEEIDLIIYCTGYKISFPFFDPAVVSAPDNKIPLYRRVIAPEHPGLYFIGFLQPLGAIMPIAEAQSEWVADLLQGKVEMPDAETMRRVIEREDRRMAKRYVASKRHTIQVDFYPYMRTIKRERRRGRAFLSRLLARRSHELRTGTAT